MTEIKMIPKKLKQMPTSMAAKEKELRRVETGLFFLILFLLFSILQYDYAYPILQISNLPRPLIKSAFYRTGHHTLYQLILENNEQDNHRQCRDYQYGQHQRHVHGMLTLKLSKCQRQRLL